MNTYKKQIKKIFDQNKEISCPAFPNEKVVLNSKGLHHIFYKGGQTKFARSEKEIGNGNKHFWSVIPAWRRVRGEMLACSLSFSRTTLAGHEHC